MVGCQYPSLSERIGPILPPLLGFTACMQAGWQTQMWLDFKVFKVLYRLDYQIRLVITTALLKNQQSYTKGTAYRSSILYINIQLQNKQHKYTHDINQTILKNCLLNRSLMMCSSSKFEIAIY